MERQWLASNPPQNTLARWPDVIEISGAHTGARNAFAYQGRMTQHRLMQNDETKKKEDR